MHILAITGGLVLVDNEDVQELKSLSWWVNQYGYACTKLNTGRIVYMHQYLNGVAPPGLVTDHINRTKLDNRKCNLRFVTHLENIQNRGEQTGVLTDEMLRIPVTRVKLRRKNELSKCETRQQASVVT